MEGRTICIGYKNKGGHYISLESVLGHLELFKVRFHCTVTAYKQAVEDGITVMAAYKAVIVCEINSDQDERIVMEAKEKLL